MTLPAPVDDVEPVVITADMKHRLMLETLKALAGECGPDALILSVCQAAHSTGIPREEAMRLLAPLFRTQQESVMYKMFWGAP